MAEPDSREVRQIIAELRDVSKDKRRTAVMKLGMVGGDFAVRALINALDNEHEDLIVRGRSALMLGKLKDSRAVESLIRALNAPGYQTPLYAAEALGNLGDVRAIPYLVGLVDDTTNGKDRAKDAALQALRKLGYKPADAEKKPDPLMEM